MSGRHSLKGNSLEDWLQWLESFHPQKIDLGLKRVSEVADRLHVLDWQCPVVTVAGTNGKGSCVAAIEAIAYANDYRVGAYTSPHLIDFNERVRVGKQAVSDEQLIAAFTVVESARGEISLSYFEFTTLAALVVFKQSSLDLMILEVGLGGRLDAVNVVDCSVAVITSIALDHMDWLGNTETDIAKEKAGVIRAGKPVVLASSGLPSVIHEKARTLNCPLYENGSEFSFTNELAYPMASVNVQTVTSKHADQSTSPECDNNSFTSASGSEKRTNVWQGVSAADSLSGESTVIAFSGPLMIQSESAAAALQAAYLLGLPLDRDRVRQSLESLQLPGRFQVVELEQATIILDVAHNPAAGRNIAKKLNAFNSEKRAVRCVFGILSDKDIAGFVSEIESQVDNWFPCGLQTERAISPEDLENLLLEQGCTVAGSYRCPQSAFQAAMDQGRDSARDIILIAGSFYTVGGWLVDNQVSGEHSKGGEGYG